MDRTSMKAIIRAGFRQSWDKDAVSQIARLAYQLGRLEEDGSTGAEDSSQELETELAKLGVDPAKLDSRYR